MERQFESGHREEIGADADADEKPAPTDRAYSVGEEPAPTGAGYEEKIVEEKARNDESAEGAEAL